MLRIQLFVEFFISWSSIHCLFQVLQMQRVLQLYSPGFAMEAGKSGSSAKNLATWQKYVITTKYLFRQSFKNSVSQYTAI